MTVAVRRRNGCARCEEIHRAAAVRAGRGDPAAWLARRGQAGKLAVRERLALDAAFEPIDSGTWSDATFAALAGAHSVDWGPRPRNMPPRAAGLAESDHDGRRSALYIVVAPSELAALRFGP